MSLPPLDIVIIGLSISSSWGNGHATTYRSLVGALSERGHRVLFLERDTPWYRAHRDAPLAEWGMTRLYADLAELRDTYASAVRNADLVIVGSYVPDGAVVGDWVLDIAEGARAFYDIDTPVTLAKLARGEHDYLRPASIPRYDLYLSFSGGPVLERLEREYGSPRARAWYCAVDPEVYRSMDVPARWDLGYLGTYSADRQQAVDTLMLAPARREPGRRFIVAGPQYPAHLRWPINVERREHVPPHEHAAFYSAQRFALNLTRADMVRMGYSPSVRLFEAAACAVPIISDHWPGLAELFAPGSEIVIARDAEDVRAALAMPEEHRRAIGGRMRARVLAEHTAAHRVEQLEGYLMELATT